MRYIGNKENILENIYTILQANNVSGKTFFDFFAGTTNVGRFFKSKNYQVSSSDILYLSYCLQKAYIENNSEPKFEKLLKILPEPNNKNLFSTPLETVSNYLNSLDGVEGFIFQNYTPAGTKELQQPRMYFIDENGKKIDAIRQQIENWKNDNLISESEYYVLLTSLIETIGFYSNIAGVYAAFHKHWDFRALRPLELRTIQFVDNGKENKVYNDDSMNLLDKINVDILYLDPPYNERQYAPNYHILETIAKYDEPKLRGVTGMRDYSSQKSRFCNPTTALEDLNKIAKEAKYNFLVLSYNSEGIMPSEKILDTLKQYGTVKLEQFEYARFKSNNNGLARTKKTVFEQLYILKREA
ncbi:DNA adenine methylase [Treponema succinifaciens]|uniref:site-specific DNA-methyltransferase (adenine-specific) n=1 Tax=Treponema succinifaciens (strain ATCC 33096 / DSM 2489 / 6091) TaxID=869209 RepID=F2NVA0_TRES6|nr:DNA adenine methylase [Treponema succinifaciens]AEB13610.1 Site-specific DNA-methyltransferase (adenine-specific) [Treponema succinifaciens DSM 2489]